ncbi:hypothetical protein BGX30_000658 [Mortierella sp. GBA39]|nr:hypothetical protein BGX30_000658 [Mortierella sp. GBA39]
MVGLTPHRYWKYVQLHCRGKPSPRTFREYGYPTQDHLDNWALQLKRGIEAGGLDRRLIVSVYEAIEPLAARGATCMGISILRLGSYPYSDSSSFKSRKFAYVRSLELLHLICDLNRNRHLGHLKLTGRVLNENNWTLIVFLKLFQGAPDGSTSYLEEQEGRGEARFPHLKELGLYDYAFDFKRTMEYIIKSSPNLKMLLLRDKYQPIHLKPLSNLLSRYYPRIMHLYMQSWADCLEVELAELLDSSKAGWRALDLPTAWSKSGENELGLL